MTDIVGVDREQFARIAMIAQGEFRKLLLAQTDERKAIFRQIFHTERYQALQNRLKEEAAALDRQCGELEAGLRQAAGSIRCDAPETLPDALDTDALLAALDTLLHADEAALTQAQAEHAETETQREQVLSDLGKAEALEAARGKLAEAESAWTEAQAEMKAAQAALDTATASQPEIQSRRQGITRLEDGRLITDAVGGGMFGQGRTEPGVLIKLLDSGERLGIQVHPTDAYAKKLFGSDYGKTESWHVLSTRRINDEEPKVYLGFKPGLTRELWTEYYRTQNVNAMLNALHEIPVKPGDTILVAGGTPHAIGGGCMLLEIQQPSDYTMRCETTPLSGVPYTPAQIHYGAGEQAMLDCFSYTPMTRAELERNYILRPRASTGDGWERLDHITYADTPCFALSELCGSFTVQERCFVTLISLCGGRLWSAGREYVLCRGDTFFVPAGVGVRCAESRMLICYPPEFRGTGTATEDVC